MPGFSLLIELTHNGHADMAEALLKRFPLEGPLAENRKLFIDGLILESRGELKASAGKFRAALANDPKLTLVRSELAQVLARMDETDSAKHHLELLAADAPTPEQAAGIRSFIQQLDARPSFEILGLCINRAVHKHQSRLIASKSIHTRPGRHLRIGCKLGH